MRGLLRNYRSLLLLLVLAIGAGPTVLAHEYYEISQDTECQADLAEESCIDPHSDTDCHSPCNLTSLRPPQSILVDTPPRSKSYFSAETDTLFHHYPDRLKRPPKA